MTPWRVFVDESSSEILIVELRASSNPCLTSRIDPEPLKGRDFKLLVRSFKVASMIDVDFKRDISPMA